MRVRESGSSEGDVCPRRRPSQGRSTSSAGVSTGEKTLTRSSTLHCGRCGRSGVSGAARLRSAPIGQSRHRKRRAAPQNGERRHCRNTFRFDWGSSPLCGAIQLMTIMMIAGALRRFITRVPGRAQSKAKANWTCLCRSSPTSWAVFAALPFYLVFFLSPPPLLDKKSNNNTKGNCVCISTRHAPAHLFSQLVRIKGGRSSRACP